MRWKGERNSFGFNFGRVYGLVGEVDLVLVTLRLVRVGMEEFRGLRKFRGVFD